MKGGVFRQEALWKGGEVHQSTDARTHAWVECDGRERRQAAGPAGPPSLGARANGTPEAGRGCRTEGQKCIAKRWCSSQAIPTLTCRDRSLAAGMTSMRGSRMMRPDTRRRSGDREESFGHLVPRVLLNLRKRKVYEVVIHRRYFVGPRRSHYLRTHRRR